MIPRTSSAPGTDASRGLQSRVRTGEEGLTLVETLAALVVLGLALLLGAAVVAWTQRIAGRVERRTVAADLVTSAAERLRAAPYPSVRDETRDVTGGPAAVLPAAELQLTVVEDEDLGLKRVTIEVRWGGRDPGTARLVTAVAERGVYR